MLCIVGNKVSSPYVALYPLSANLFTMNDTDVDWTVYHLIADAGTTIEDISAKSGLEREDVLASVARLEKTRLVLREDERVNPLSINDFLLAGVLSGTDGQSTAETGNDDCEVYIENGIIKVRK